MATLASSPAGAVLLGALVMGGSRPGGERFTCLGIDGAPPVCAPAGEFSGFECDPNDFGISQSTCHDLARDALAILVERGGQGIDADRDELRVICLCRPKHGGDEFTHGVLLWLPATESFAEGV